MIGELNGDHSTLTVDRGVAHANVDGGARSHISADGHEDAVIIGALLVRVPADEPALVMN